ncbi:unnamed protein product [Rotaria sordida]|uniref:Uncharacterized protein n=1 Tax=Rotaria sordida TaxID=392033 RepID=A0A815CE41_9BILA|nr:unnamed protein product [Rotaria sordida]
MTENKKVTIVVEGNSNIGENAVFEVQPMIEKAGVLIEEKPNVGNEDVSEQQATNKKSSITGAVVPDKAIQSLGLFGSVGLLIFFGLLTPIPIAEIIIGRYYVNDCPVNPKIPHYLFVTGVVVLIHNILIIIKGIVITTIINPAKKVRGNDSKAVGISTGIACITCIILLIIFALTIFAIGWTIAGLIWVFGAWNKVQYSEPTQSTYCHPTLYRFTYWLFFLPFIIPVVLCCICCCSICGVGAAAATMSNKGRQPVPTTEA